VSGDLFMVAFLLSLLSCRCRYRRSPPVTESRAENRGRGLRLRDELLDLPQHRRAVDTALVFIV
jgi:hypothetical protein